MNPFVRSCVLIARNCSKIAISYLPDGVAGASGGAAAAAGAGAAAGA